MSVTVDLYDFAPVGYLVVDDHGHVLSVNLLTCQLLGEGRRSLVDRPVSDLVALHDRTRFDEFWRQVTNANWDPSGEFDLVHASGDFVTVACHARRSFELSAWLVGLIDVSELHEARREAEDRHELARRTDIAHHLYDSIRQRLFGVAVMIEGIAALGELPERSGQALERAHGELTAMVAEIRRLIFEDL